MNAQLGFVLAAVICIAILSIWNLILMLVQPARVPRPSIALVVIAIFSAAAILHFRAIQLRLAFAIAGTQAAARAVLWLAGAPRGLQRVAALGGEMLTVLAVIIVSLLSGNGLTLLFISILHLIERTPLREGPESNRPAPDYRL